MKPISEQDHYEILEVSASADPQEIERAYRLARATYVDDSLAGYSLMGEGDAEVLRERIEIAYRVLSDPGSRSAYDSTLTGDSASGEEPKPAVRESRIEPLPAVEELEELESEHGEYDGARLRRSRLRRGIELEQVAGITKINPTYLRFLEEDRFADLPARVYVRGFVMAYAQCLGLDADRVANSYLKHYETESEHPGARRANT